MTPNEIITRAVQAIPGIRMPMAKLTVERILKDLADEGYEIKERHTEAIGRQFLEYP